MTHRTDVHAVEDTASVLDVVQLSRRRGMLAHPCLP